MSLSFELVCHFSEVHPGQFLQHLFTNGTDFHPTAAEKITGISLGSNASDLDQRAVDLLLGDQIDNDQVKVSEKFSVKNKNPPGGGWGSCSLWLEGQ